MEIEVSLQGKHKITVSSSTPGSEPFVTTDRFLNLAEESICTHPFESRNNPEPGPLFCSLQEKVPELFRCLSFVESSSPLVAQLIHYYECELESALQYITKPQSHSYEDVQQKAHSLALNQTNEADCYKRIIQRIIQEVPDFFAVEQKLGILPFIKSLDPKDLPFRLSKDAPPHHLAPLTPHNTPHEEGVLFYRKTNRVYSQGVQLPTTEELIVSLATCGMTSKSVNVLNRIAALIRIYQAPPRGMACRTHEEKSPLKDYIQASLLNAALGTISLPLLYTAGTFITEGQMLAASASAWIGLTAGLLGGVFQIIAHDTWQREKISNLPIWLSQQTEELILHPDNVSRSLLTTVLFHTLSYRSSSREMTPIDKQQTKMWYEAIEKIRNKNPLNLNPEEHDLMVACLVMQDAMFSCDRVPFQISDLESKCADNLFSKLVQELLHIEPVKTAETSWEMIQAIESVVSFTNRGIRSNYAESDFFSSLDLLPRLRASRTSQNDDIHADLQRIFDEMLAFHALDRETWAFIAQPLLAVDIIERNKNSWVAADIATEELFRM